MLARMVQRIPELNLNWLFTGKGVALVDHDAIYGRMKYAYYQDKLACIQADLMEMHEMIGKDLRQDRLHSSYIEFWDGENKRLINKASDPQRIRLGVAEKVFVKLILDGGKVIKKGNTIHMSKDGSEKYVPERMVNRLLKKNVLIESKLKSHTKYRINANLKKRIIASL